jgi:hypothetical protein
MNQSVVPPMNFSTMSRPEMIPTSKQEGRSTFGDAPFMRPVDQFKPAEKAIMKKHTSTGTKSSVMQPQLVSGKNVSSPRSEESFDSDYDLLNINSDDEGPAAGSGSDAISELSTDEDTLFFSLSRMC